MENNFDDVVCSKCGKLLRPVVCKAKTSWVCTSCDVKSDVNDLENLNGC